MTPREPPDRDVRAFDITSHGRGDQSKDIVVDLPTCWARHRDDARVHPDACEFPVTLDEDGTWEDLEQGWWATITDVSGTLCIAETDLDALMAAPMPVVDVSCEEAWSRPRLRRCCPLGKRPRAAYEAAWREAVASVRE